METGDYSQFVTASKDSSTSSFACYASRQCYLFPLSRSLTVLPRGARPLTYGRVHAHTRTYSRTS